MTLFICYLTFVFLFTWTAHRNTNRFYSTFCGHVHFNNQQRSQHYFTFCVFIHLNCPQKNQHNLLDTLWWCSLEQPTEKLTYFAWHFVVMLLEPPTDKPTYFTWHFVFIFTWTAHRKNNIFYLTFVVILLEQASEKSTYFTWHFVYYVHLNSPQRNQQ